MEKQKGIPWYDNRVRFELLPSHEFVEETTKRSTFETVKGETRTMVYTLQDFKFSKREEGFRKYHPLKLIEIVRSIKGAKMSPEYNAMPGIHDDECYYKIDLPTNKIRFQINIGKKEPSDVRPEIAIDTLGSLPDVETLEAVKKVIRYIASKIDVQVQCYGKLFLVEEFLFVMDEWREDRRQAREDMGKVIKILSDFFEGDKFSFDRDKFSESVRLVKGIYCAIPSNNKFAAGRATQNIHEKLSAVVYLIKEQDIKIDDFDAFWQLLEAAFLFMDKIEVFPGLIGHGYGPDSTKRAFSFICYLMDLLKSRHDEEEFQKKFNKIQHNIKESGKEQPRFILTQAVKWVR